MTLTNKVMANLTYSTKKKLKYLKNIITKYYFKVFKYIFK